MIYQLVYSFRVDCGFHNFYSALLNVLTMSIFQEHHEEDFFLYIAYSDESVYGN